MPFSNELAQQVLAVIPTLNEENYIEDCLRSLMVGASTLNDVSFVVVDGGSNDRTVEIVEELKLEFKNLALLHNPKKLQSAALNIAAQNAPDNCTVLVRCDAHSIYPENFVLKVASKLTEIGSASVVVPMDAVGGSGFQEANAWVVDKPFGSGGSAHRGGHQSGYIDHGHHAAFDLKVYRELGGYDEVFSHNEDAEYDHRVVQAGHKIYIDADSRIQYMPRPTFTGLWKQYFKYGRGRAMNMRKHGGKPKLRQSIPILNFLSLSVCALVWSLSGIYGGVFSNWFTALLALGPLLYFVALFFVGLLGVIGLKKLSGFHAASALFAMHNAWAIGFLKAYFITPPKNTTLETAV